MKMTGLNISDIFPLCSFVLMKYELGIEMFWLVTLFGWLNDSWCCRRS